MTTTDFAAHIGTNIWALQKLLDRRVIARPPKVLSVSPGHRRYVYDWPEERADEIRAAIAAAPHRRRLGGLRGSSALEACKRLPCTERRLDRAGKVLLCVETGDGICPRCERGEAMGSRIVAGIRGGSLSPMQAVWW